MDFLKGFTTLDEVGEDSQVRKLNFKPATAAEEIDYLNVILANIEKQNAKDNTSVELIPNENNNSSVALKQNGCTDVEGSNAVTCELSHVDDILTQARRRDQHMLNNHLGDSVNGQVQSGLSTEPTTHVLLNPSSQDSDGNFNNSCVSADQDEDLDINVGVISLAVLNNVDDKEGDDEAGSSELSPSTTDASLIIPSGSGVDESGEVLESGYDPARDTSYGCLSGKEDSAVSSKNSPLDEKPVVTNIVLCGIHELLADTSVKETDHSALCEDAIEQSATCGEFVEQLGTVLKESIDQSSVCVGSFEESATSCEESFDQAAICEESFDQAAICEESFDQAAICEESFDQAAICEESFDQTTIGCNESFDQSTIGCNESFDQSTVCDVSFDHSTVHEDSLEQSATACADITEQSIFVGGKHNHIDLSIVKSEPLDADPGEDFDFDSFIHDPGENFRIKEEPRSEDEMQDYSSPVNPGFENVALYGIKLEEPESAEPYVPEQRFKVKNKFYNKEQVTAAYLISQSTLSASVDMAMFRGIGKTDPVLKLHPLEDMIKKPEVLVAEDADIVKLFAKNFGCNIDEWKVKHKFRKITARKHTIKNDKFKKSPKGRKQKEKPQRSQEKENLSDSDFRCFDSNEIAKGKKSKDKKVDHSKVFAVIKENSDKKKSHKKKEKLKDKSAHSETDSVKKRKKKQRTLSKEVLDSDSSDSEPEHRTKQQQKITDSSSSIDEADDKKGSLKMEVKVQLEGRSLKDRRKARLRTSTDADSSSYSSETLQNEFEDGKPNKLGCDASNESQDGYKESSKIGAKKRSIAEDLKCRKSELAVEALSVRKEITDLRDIETEKNEYCSLDRSSEISNNQVERFVTKGEGSKAFKGESNNREENESEKDDLTDGELNVNVSDIISRLEVEEETTSSDCVDFKFEATVASGADATDPSEKMDSETKCEKSSLKERNEKSDQDEKLLDGYDNVKVCKDVEHGKSSPKHSAITEVEVEVKTENLLACDEDDSIRALENDRVVTAVSEDIIIKDGVKCKACVVKITDLMLLKDYQKFVKKSLKRLGLRPKIQVQNLSPLKLLDIELSGEKSGRDKSREPKEKHKKTDKERAKEDREPEIRRKTVDKDKRFLKDFEEERTRRHLEKSERKTEKDRKRQLEEEEKNSPQLQFPTIGTSFRIPKKKGSTGTYLQELRQKATAVTSVVSKREDLKKPEKTSMYSSTKTFFNRRDDRKTDRTKKKEGYEQDDIRQNKREWQNNPSWKVDQVTGMKKPPSPAASPVGGDRVPAWVEGKEVKRELENIPNINAQQQKSIPDMGGWQAAWNAAGDDMEEDNHLEDDFMDNEVGNSPEDTYCAVGKENLEKRADKPSMLDWVHATFEKPDDKVTVEEKPSLLSFVNELYGENEKNYDSHKGADVHEFYDEESENKKIELENDVKDLVDKKYFEHSRDEKGTNPSDFVDGPTTSENAGKGIDRPSMYEQLEAFTSSSAFVEPPSKDAKGMTEERELFLKVLAMEEERTKAAAGEGKNNTKVSNVTGPDKNLANVPSTKLEAVPNLSLNKEQSSGDSAAKDVIKVPVEVVVSKKEISPGVYLVKKTRHPGAPVASQNNRECLSGVKEKGATLDAEAVVKAKMLGALPTVGEQVKEVKEPGSLKEEAVSETGEEEDDVKGKLDYSSLDRRQKVKLYERRKRAYYEAKKKFLQEKTEITSHQHKRARFEECERLKKEYYDLKMHLYEEKKREEAKKRGEHEKHKKVKPDSKHTKARTSEGRRQSADSKIDEYDPENAPLLELPPDPDDGDAPYSPTGSPIVDDEIYHINTRTSLLDDQQASFKDSIAKLEKIQKGKLNTITEDDSENLQSMVLALLENIKQIPVADASGKINSQCAVTKQQLELLRAKAIKSSELSLALERNQEALDKLSSVSFESKSAKDLDRMLPECPEKTASVASTSANISSVSVTSTTVSLTTTSVTSSVVSVVKSPVLDVRTSVQQPSKVSMPLSSRAAVHVPVSSSNYVPTPVPPPIKSSVPTPVPTPSRLMPVPAPAPVPLVLTRSSSGFTAPVPPPLNAKILPPTLSSQLSVPEKEAQPSLPTKPPVTGREAHQSLYLQPTTQLPSVSGKEAQPPLPAQSQVPGKAQPIPHAQPLVPGKEAQFPPPEQLAASRKEAQPPSPPHHLVPGKEVQPPPLPPEPQPPPLPEELQPPPPPPPPEESNPPPPHPSPGVQPLLPPVAGLPHVKACTANLPPPPFMVHPPNFSSGSLSYSVISTLTSVAPPPIPALKPPPPPPCIPSMTEMLDSVPMDLDSDMECESGGEEEPILTVSEYLIKETDEKLIENISYSYQEGTDKDDDSSFLASFGVKLDSPEIEEEAPSLCDVVNDYFSRSKPYADTPVAKLMSTNPDESFNDSLIYKPSERPVSCETSVSVSSTPSHTSKVSKAFSHSKHSISSEKDLTKKLFSEDEILENVQRTDDEVDLEVIFASVRKDKRKTVGDEALNYYQKTTLAQSIIDQCKDVPLVGLQYVLEVRLNAKTTLDDAYYICALCSKKMDAHTLLAHIKSVPHRLKFSEIHCRDMFAKFGTITLKQWTAALVKEFTDALLDVEVKLGRHKLAVAYEKDMSVVLASLKSKIEDMTELSLSQKRLDKNISSRDSREHKAGSIDAVALDGPRTGIAKLEGSRKGDHSKSSSPKRKRSRSPRRSPRRRSRSRDRGGDRSSRGALAGSKRRRSRSRSLSRSRSPRSRRHRSRSRSPRHRSPHRRGDRRSRHSPRRSRDRSEERRKNAEKRRIEDFRHAEQRLRQRHKELEEEFDKCPESHPKYNEEWALFWERRYRELETQGLDPSRHDFKSEWAVYWRKRMKELNFIFWNQKRQALLNRFVVKDPGPPIEENLGSMNGTSKKQPLSRIDRSLSPWEDDNNRSAKNPSPPPQNSGALNIMESIGSGSDRKSSLPKCEEDYSVIGTLKLLNELEDHLGSFGPAVATLLSKAVTLEEKGENPLDLFKDLDNSVLIRYAKEKLASQISAGILGGQNLAKTESAIERSMWLQIQAEKLTGRDKFLGLDINNIAKATMGMDTVQIAQYIAHHLLQIGKSNASEENLQNILVAVSASHADILANPLPVASNSSSESHKATAEINQKKDGDSVARPSVSVSENAALTTSAAQAPKTALFPSGDPSTQAQTSATNSTTNTEAANKSSGPAGLSLLQSAYEDESPKDMNKLSLDDLQALLGNFRSLSREEQQALTTYLKKLEATDSKKVTQLRERMQKSAAKPVPKPSPSQSKPIPSSMSPAPSIEGKKDPVIPPSSNAVPSQTAMTSHVPAGPPHSADANLNSNAFQPNLRLPPHSPNNHFPVSNVSQQENFPRNYPNHGPQYDHQSRNDAPEKRTPPLPSKPVEEPVRGLEDLLHDYRMSSSPSGDLRSKDQPMSQSIPPHPTGFNNPDLRGGAFDGRDLNRPMPSEMRENQIRGPYSDRERDFLGLFKDREREFRGPYDHREPNQQGRFDAREPGRQGPYGNRVPDVRGPYGNREPDMHRPFDGEGNIGRPFDSPDMRMRDPMMDRGNPGFQDPGYSHRGFPDQGNLDLSDRGFDERSGGMPFRDYREPEFPPRDSMGMYDQRPGEGRGPVGLGSQPMPLRNTDFNNRFPRDGPPPSFSRGSLPFEADEFATDTFRSGTSMPQPRGPMAPRGYMDPRPPYQGRW